MRAGRLFLAFSVTLRGLRVTEVTRMSNQEISRRRATAPDSAFGDAQHRWAGANGRARPVLWRCRNLPRASRPGPRAPRFTADRERPARTTGLNLARDYGGPVPSPRIAADRRTRLRAAPRSVSIRWNAATWIASGRLVARPLARLLPRGAQGVSVQDPVSKRTGARTTGGRGGTLRRRALIQTMARCPYGLGGKHQAGGQAIVGRSGPPRRQPHPTFTSNTW
jgi:hypothetical protein